MSDLPCKKTRKRLAIQIDLIDFGPRGILAGIEWYNWMNDGPFPKSPAVHLWPLSPAQKYNAVRHSDARPSQLDALHNPLR